MSPPQQQTSNCSSLLIYRPGKDERLSWPSWLIYSGWFTHISGHPSGTGQAQDSESTPAKDRCSIAGPHNQKAEKPRCIENKKTKHVLAPLRGTPGAISPIFPRNQLSLVVIIECTTTCGCDASITVVFKCCNDEI